MQRADREDGEASAVLTDVREEPRQLRPVVVAAVIGSFVEYYDFAVYGALAAILSVVFFPPGNPTAALLSTFAIQGAWVSSDDEVIAPSGWNGQGSTKTSSTSNAPTF